jgi:putative SOS response-associated peptidase YedK
MCGRFTTIFTFKELKDEFCPGTVAKNFEQSFHRSYNVSPQSQIPVVYTNVEEVGDNQRTLALLHWGLVPSWAKDPTAMHNPINVRAEGIHERPMFKDIVTGRRCLIPASGFYEWKNPEREGGAKRPFYIRLKDRGIFSFAGIWDSWKTPKGTALDTCSIVTTTPNATVGPIHDRMPVILRRKDEDRWLDTRLVDRMEISSLLSPYEANEMEAYEISTLVNRPENDSSDVIAPAGLPRPSGSMDGKSKSLLSYTK